MKKAPKDMIDQHAEEVANFFLDEVKAGKVDYTCRAVMFDYCKQKSLEVVDTLAGHGYTCSTGKYFPRDSASNVILSRANQIVFNRLYGNEK